MIRRKKFSSLKKMMKRRIAILGLLVVFQQVAAETNIEPGVYSGGLINEFVDRTLAMVRPAMVENGFDPFRIDNISRDFWFKLLLVNYTGHIDLKNGWLHDLSTIHRYGDAYIKYDRKLLTLSVDLLVDCLMANFDHKTTIFNIGPTGKLTAKMRKQVIQFGIQVDFETITFHLQRFTLRNDADVKISVTGLGLADIVVGVVVDALTAIFKNSVIEGIGKQIRTAIEDLIDKLPPLLPPLPPSPTTMHVSDKFLSESVEDYSGDSSEEIHFNAHL